MKLVYIAAAWAIGIHIAQTAPQINANFWLGGFMLCLALGWAFRRSQRLLLLASVAAVCAGAWRMAIIPPGSAVAAYNGSAGTVTGIVAVEPALRDDRILLRVETESIFVHSQNQATSGLALVEAPRSATVAFGDRIRATGSLTAPPVWDTFSYADYLSRQGIYSRMPNAAVEVISAGHGDPIQALLIELRQSVKRNIGAALPDPQASLLTGILAGDESGITAELAEDFSRVGASHVIAISGFNMVVVSAIVFRVVLALSGGDKPFAGFCAVAIILVYAIFVGASPGVMRAALMSSLVIVGDLLRRKTFKPASLAFAALILLVSDPYSLQDLGFQLSFCAVLGLVLFADPLSEWLKRLLQRILPRRPARIAHGFLAEPLAATMAAQMTTLPLTILYFGKLSLVALPVNLLIVPAQSALLALGLAAIAVYAIAPALGSLLLWADMPFLSWTIEVVRAFAGLGFAEQPVAVDGRVIQVFYMLLIGGAIIKKAQLPATNKALAVIRRRAARVGMAGGFCVALVLTVAMVLSRGDGQLHVWLLDLGHSNAILMQSPGGAHILVDGGPFPSRLLTAIGDRLPFYDREIELLAITHPDPWDTAALTQVIGRYKIGAALYHGQPNTGDAFQRIITQLEANEAPLVQVRAGYQIRLDDGLVLDVLHPPVPPAITDNLHNNALVLRVSYGNTAFLLTSDLGRDGQQAMLSRGERLAATVLQLPQHASRSSLDEGFLRGIQPQLAMTQIDAANTRGDPDLDTLTLLGDLPVLRTDANGAVHISSDGRRLFVHS
ncbi:MAG: ComEC/Rec2 family competence protein [Chloroflexi bacterium]|nr:ComEC/Rec2 family competence protein [Chloroflexota bacterium]MCY4246526.1 ComEC/Rec2 family competence protein [Chloroflexota bacterium]